MCQTASNRPRGLFPARVLENRLLCLDHYQLVLELERFPATAPGQFVTVRCGDTASITQPHEIAWEPGKLPVLSEPELTGRQPLLRRPFSLAGRREAGGKVQLEIIHHVVGVGTAWLAEAKPGQVVDVLGPLGHGFTIFPDRPLAAILGGGVGIPPMLYLAGQLSAAGKQVVAFAGARTRSVLPLTIDPSEPPSTAGWPTMCAAEFAAHSTPAVIATDDGSLGMPGFVSQAFQRWLNEHRPAPKDLTVYACGPGPMMKAVADIALPAGYECQLALERHMGCGLGTCQSCIVKVKADEPPGWQYKLTCKDGPVFDARQLVW